MGIQLPNTVVGTVDSFAANAVPTGWLKCNGALVSRVTYAALFAAIGTTYGVGDGSTTFAVPDLRGVFLRGFDDGRGVDVGRGFGTEQADQNKKHSHGVTDGGHSHSISYQGTLGFSGGGGYGGTAFGGSPNQNTNPAATGISINADGGSEARPRNLAMIFCIKT